MGLITRYDERYCTGIRKGRRISRYTYFKARTDLFGGVGGVGADQLHKMLVDVASKICWRTKLLTLSVLGPLKALMYSQVLEFALQHLLRSDMAGEGTQRA